MKVDNGFTLIETLITCAIIAILAAISLVAYRDYVRQAKRSGAIQTALSIQMEQEKYRANNTSYGTLAQVWGGVTTSSEGHYTIAISSITPTSYTITLTAVGDQANDSQDGTSCTPMVLTKTNNSDTKTPVVCW